MKDDQLSRQRRFIRPAPSPPIRSTLSPPSFNRAAPTVPTNPIRRLTWEEMQRRRAQNLCFNCNDRFTAGHKCREPRILMLEGYDGSNTLLCDNEGEDQPVQENFETTTKPEITLHALTGWATPKTMRITTRIGSNDVIALIESGSTHNFISERLANALRILVVPTTTFTVRVANGEKLKCQGRSEEVGVDLQGTHFSLTLYSLPLTGLDLVLGIQWLEMLGSVVCNWKQLTMEFWWKNQLRRLQGMDDEGIQIASITELTKTIHQNHAIFAICLQVSTTEPYSQTTHPDIEAILHEFSDILKEPTGLPPIKGVDHCISLKDGTEPINVRPYRYAYYQK